MFLEGFFRLLGKAMFILVGVSDRGVGFTALVSWDASQMSRVIWLAGLGFSTRLVSPLPVRRRRSLRGVAGSTQVDAKRWSARKAAPLAQSSHTCRLHSRLSTRPPGSGEVRTSSSEEEATMTTAAIAVIKVVKVAHIGIIVILAAVEDGGAIEHIVVTHHHQLRRA